MSAPGGQATVDRQGDGIHAALTGHDRDLVVGQPGRGVYVAGKE
ncbi:hypothetical protein [Micromonospora endolithica]|nr:hypothetical protein [Micromonospora endolithica]TWJ19918.1 hypothetical protein JD76_00003 [Micromonospora endolithica]TWJ26325.1 hypothetical protein JD76_06506 [Micromonospora endolithica]